MPPYKHMVIYYMHDMYEYINMCYSGEMVKY